MSLAFTILAPFWLMLSLLLLLLLLEVHITMMMICLSTIHSAVHWSVLTNFFSWTRGEVSCFCDLNYDRSSWKIPPVKIYTSVRNNRRILKEVQKNYEVIQFNKNSEKKFWSRRLRFWFLQSRWMHYVFAYHYFILHRTCIMDCTKYNGVLMYFLK